MITIIAATLTSSALYYLLHPFWAKDFSEGTRKTVELVAMRVGVVYAVVIGMMFANVRLEHFQMVEAIESEASALIRLSKAIQQEGGEETDELRQELVGYVKFIIDEQWPALREARAFPEKDIFAGGGQRLKPVWDYVAQTEAITGNRDLRRLLDQVEHYHILRVFDKKGNLLPLFWYIAFFGYLATLVTLFVYPPNLHRYTLVSLYSSMVAIVLLGIFILTHPYSISAGLEPSIFKWIIDLSAG
jgi:ABC-type amino acid transport system permease subunit